MKQIPLELKRQFDNPLGILDERHTKLLYRKVIFAGLRNFILGSAVLIALVTVNPHPSHSNAAQTATGAGALTLLFYWIGYGLYQLLTFKNRAEDRVRDMLIARHPELKTLEKERKLAHAQKLIISPLVFSLGVIASLLLAVIAGIIFLT